MALILLLAGAAGVWVVTHTGDEGARPMREAGGRGARPAERTSFLARLIPPPPERIGGPGIPRSIADLASRLPLERRVAQLFVWGFRGRDLTAPIFRALERLDLGGIVVEARNYESPQQLATLAGEAVAISRGHAHVPPWVMAAQEGGRFSEFPDLPPAKAPGDIRSPGEAAALAREAAATLGPLGVNAVLAPSADVAPGGGGFLGERAHSDEPARVAAFAAATVRAYRDGGVLPAPKHFPGLGAASQPTDEGPASVGLSLAELRRRDLVPFRAAIRAGAPAVVLGHAAYATDDFVTPASLSRAIATGLLRDELGFRGVAITDDLAAPAVTAIAPVPDAAIEAIRAGADLVYVSGPRGDAEAAYRAVLDAAREGKIPRARIDEALLRTLKAKRELGLIR